MQADYLIIGQGISGTWLSYFLQKKGKSFIVIDNHDKNAPSRIAAGIINPVTGRRHATVWMADKTLSFAWDIYEQMGNELGIRSISLKNILDFFPSPQMRESFMRRVGEKGEFVFDVPGQEQFKTWFHYEFGCGEIRPVYTAHLEILLPAWRQQLASKGQLIEEEFDITRLSISPDSIQYGEIITSGIIFCDGNGSTQNPYFSLLPFAPNKGEALLVEIPGLPADRIYKKGMMLVPLGEPAGMWWVGSNYAWEFEHAWPTGEFREKTERLLKEWLRIPFSIREHLAGIRPATLERRPFVGRHPRYPGICILNGMGTKGCSLAPYFARQLVQHLVHGEPINAEADISRFEKILTRKMI